MVAKVFSILFAYLFCKNAKGVFFFVVTVSLRVWYIKKCPNCFVPRLWYSYILRTEVIGEAHYIVLKIKHKKTSKLLWRF
ncbi:hypothetical protein CXF59_12695 [Flavobacterium sp. ALD4]|nr:hypothetical protein CXF59_12695 [Flavobacterium sp. ALD4]